MLCKSITYKTCLLGIPAAHQQGIIEKLLCNSDLRESAVGILKKMIQDQEEQAAAALLKLSNLKSSSLVAPEESTRKSKKIFWMLIVTFFQDPQKCYIYSHFYHKVHYKTFLSCLGFRV